MKEVGEAHQQDGIPAKPSEAASLGVANATSAADEEKAPVQPKPKVQHSFSRGLATWLANHNVSLAITSYQTGSVYLVGSDQQGRVTTCDRVFERAMGIVGDAQQLYLGTAYQVWRLENVLRPNELIRDTYDKCYVPRIAHVTGELDIHELGIRDDGAVVFVNTKYSCLAELSPTHSFKPIWKPKFISRLAPEDRCHLNGMAMVDGRPRYVTAVCKSDVVDGWREHRHDGGIVIDVDTDEIVCEGLSMPHSPRWANGKLWLLNAGSGHLGWVDFATKKFVPVAFFPGFLRGMSIMGDVVAVGLSKPRHEERFEGLALDDELRRRDATPWCGVQIASLSSGDVLNWMRCDGDMTEIFDTCFLPGVRNPVMIGLRTSEIRDLVTY